MTSTDAIAAKNAFVLITNKFVIKANALLRRPCCHEIQSVEANYFAGKKSNHGAWLDHELSLLLIFKLTAWIAANVYAYVHGHTRTRGRIHAIICL